MEWRGTRKPPAGCLPCYLALPLPLLPSSFSCHCLLPALPQPVPFLFHDCPLHTFYSYYSSSYLPHAFYLFSSSSVLPSFFYLLPTYLPVIPPHTPFYPVPTYLSLPTYLPLLLPTYHLQRHLPTYTCATCISSLHVHVLPAKLCRPAYMRALPCMPHFLHMPLHCSADHTQCRAFRPLHALAFYTPPPHPACLLCPCCALHSGWCLPLTFSPSTPYPTPFYYFLLCAFPPIPSPATVACILPHLPSCPQVPYFTTYLPTPVPVPTCATLIQYTHT